MTPEPPVAAMRTSMNEDDKTEKLYRSGLIVTSGSDLYLYQPMLVNFHCDGARGYH